MIQKTRIFIIYIDNDNRKNLLKLTTNMNTKTIGMNLVDAVLFLYARVPGTCLVCPKLGTRNRSSLLLILKSRMEVIGIFKEEKKSKQYGRKKEKKTTPFYFFRPLLLFVNKLQ